MSRLSDLGKLPVLNKDETLEVNVACGQCFAQSDGWPFYNRQKKILFWKCENGHENVIDNWTLGA